MHTTQRIIRFTVCAFLALVILAYAMLITIGRWQLDEYSELYKMRATPRYFFDRLMWSPRPISELLYSAYGWTVNYFHHSFIVPFLGLLWLLLLIAVLYTSAQRVSEHRKYGWPFLLVALTLVALDLSAGDATEVFYWPAGSVAYIPTLAATLLLFLQILDGRLNTKQGRILAAVCLIVAAGCTEAGATFVLCYGVVQGFQWIREAWSRRTTMNSRPLLWVGIPFILAVAVLVIVRMNRFRASELSVEHPVPGNLTGSVIASGKEMAFEIIGRSMLASTYHRYPDPHLWFHSGLRLPLEMLVGSHLWMEFFLLISVVLLWSGTERLTKQTVRQVLELCMALLAAALLIIAASNLHFGNTCCERHELLRESWWNMILVGLAVAASFWLSNSRRRQLARFSAFAPILLSLAILSLGFVGPLAHTYQSYNLLRRARVQNSESGFQQNNDPMRYSVLPSEGIIAEEAIPTGTYRRSREITQFSIDLYPYYLLRFFDKKAIVIQPLAIPREFEAKQNK